MVHGGWVVAAALIGALGPLAATWLNSYLNPKHELDQYDKAAMSLLKSMLSQGQKWRTLATLSNVIGANEKDTKELLLMLGARASENRPDLWGLISLNPLPQKPGDAADPSTL